MNMQICPKCGSFNLEDQGPFQRCLVRKCNYTHREKCGYPPCKHSGYYPYEYCLYHQAFYDFVKWFFENRQLRLAKYVELYHEVQS